LIYIKLNSHNELLSFEGNDKVVKEINLRGGHKCFLAPESKIQFQNAKKADTLYLDGEGYFETSRAKPLIIIAKNTITKCLNSKIDIRAIKQSKNTVINSISGKVSSHCMDNDFPEMLIEPDEQCTIYEGGIYAGKEPNTDPNFLAWKTGNLCFSNIPLSHAIKTLEELYNVKIELQSPDIKYCRLSSEFENTNFESVLEYIQCHYNAVVKRSRTSIVLEGGMCKN
jgi:ferric-dicitrate binding protein FerR (iron transport regulator)